MINGIFKECKEGVLFTPSCAFDLKQILKSGQCFRIKEYNTDEFIAITGLHVVKIHKYLNGYIFHCPTEIFINIWIPYFDLNTDYATFQSQIKDDSFLERALKFGDGIRILRQDLWETIVSFIISQRNNIPRIQKSIELLCQHFGSYLTSIDGRKIYAFPTREQLVNSDISVASLGYREDYIKDLCSNPNFNLDAFQSGDFYKTKENLLQIRGVGEKVANCIMLFGLHYMDSYPKDVWVNKLINDVYNGNFDVTKYTGFAGYIQQLQFYYYRNIVSQR